MKTQVLIFIILIFNLFITKSQNTITDSITISSKQLEMLNDENSTMQRQSLDLQNQLIELGVRKTITFKYNGEWVTYGVVYDGSRYWMDRNLGAKRVATSVYDTLSIGDFYQWGRAADGHQLLTNTKVTYTLSQAGQQPTNDSIILWKEGKYNLDWNANSNWTTRWEDGSRNPKISTNVCPDGWHVPTMPEWATVSMNWTNEESGFQSPLKLMLYEPNSPSNFKTRCGQGYWTSTPADNKTGAAWYLLLCRTQKPMIIEGSRIVSNQVRCIKDR